jgi:integrase
MKSYHVRIWSLRAGKAETRRSYEARWKVGPVPHSRSFGNKAQAESFLSELRHAARSGEAFDTGTGLPDSMVRPPPARTWFDFCIAYVDMKWPHAAPKSRDGITEALAVIIPAMAGEPPPDWLEPADLRRALRQYALPPGARDAVRPPEIAAALRWLEKASLPVSEVGKPAQARAALEAISVRHDGSAAGATTIARKRAVLANVLRYAVELDELSVSLLPRLSWKPPKASEVVDRRVVVNPRQARELLTAVTYVGRPRRGYSRGQRLMAMYACMYFAALRPGEAVALRRQDCYLPESGWGRLTLARSRPEVNLRWTDSGSAHAERGLKHRPAGESRTIPIPPELVRILRAHIDTFGLAADDRLFSSDRGQVVASTAISDVWAKARTLALAPEQVASALAGRPYDLRHAAVSLWLNAGVPPQDVADRAGHSVDVLLRVYAKCLDGGETVANKRIATALHDED